jgi:hypothetical protein
MSIESLGAQQQTPANKVNKTQNDQQKLFSQPMEKLFQDHSQILTRILNDGVKIPEEELKKVLLEKDELKKAYFGIENKFITPDLLTQNISSYIIFHTTEIPIILPKTFFDVPADSSFSNKKITINIIKDEGWWKLQSANLEICSFLKPALTCFSKENFKRNLVIKGVEYSTSSYLPVNAIVYSTKWNLLAFLLFCIKNKYYFSHLEEGIRAFLTKVKNL